MRSDPIFQKYVDKIGRFPENMANSPMNLPEKFKKMAILSGYFTEASKMPAKDITAIW
jgi:ribosomal protein S18